MNTKIIDLSAIFNKELTRAILSKSTIEKSARSVRRGTFVDSMKVIVLNIQRLMYALS